jgi:hypothetical protein
MLPAEKGDHAMKKFLIATAAMAAAFGALTTSASAAPYDRNDRSGYGQNDQNINRQQAEIQRRIDVGVRNRSITQREAFRLRSELRDIARLEARYRYNGLSVAERRDLDRRLDRVSVQVRFERHDNDRRDHWRS